MAQITILLVDNEPRTAELIQGTLQLEFEGIGIQPAWTLKGDAISARRSVRTDGPVDVALIDLYLSEDRMDRDGVTVIKDIRDRNQDAYILAMTGHPDWSPSFRSELDSIVTHAIDKTELRESGSWSWATLARSIREYLIQAGRINVGHITWDRDDSGIASILEAIARACGHAGDPDSGARALRLLATRCLGDRVANPENINISYLTAGRSGASVCRLDMSGPGSPSRAFIMKFGLDRRALERERTANREAGSVLSQQSLMAIVGELGSHESGYHAIAARVADNALSLRRWLESTTTGEARALAEIILCELLEPFYREDGRREVQMAEWLRLSATRKLRTQAVIDRYGRAIGDARTGARADSGQLIGTLARFIDRADHGISPSGRLSQLCGYVRSFGDLHSGNILVQPGVHQRPVFIDASLYGEDHWSSDNARLLADLVLRVRRPGVEAMVWLQPLDLDSHGARLCPYCPAAHGPAADWDDTPVDAFLARAVQLLPDSTHQRELSIDRTDWHWEWHLGLAREFLRQSSHEDLTPPRACLALTAAAEHLRIAEQLG